MGRTTGTDQHHAASWRRRAGDRGESRAAATSGGGAGCHAAPPDPASARLRRLPRPTGPGRPSQSRPGRSRPLPRLLARLGEHVRLEIVISPYRAVVAPLARYLQALHQQRPELTLTVIVPETIVRHRRHRLLHPHVAARLRRVLRMQPETVISTIPFHLPT